MNGDIMSAYLQDSTQNPEEFFVAMEANGDWSITEKDVRECKLDESLATLLASTDNEKFVQAMCFIASSAGDRVRRENATLINQICSSIPFIMEHKDGERARPYWAGLKELSRHPEDWRLEFPEDWIERKNGAIVNFLGRRGLPVNAR